MAVLSSNVNKQNIVNRFVDYTTATANSGISWGTNSIPFAEFNGAEFGGDTSGLFVGISGDNLPDANIVASSIYNVLLSETNAYSHIRNLRAVRTYQTEGTVDINWDGTAVAYMNTGYLQSLGSPSDAGVVSAANITAGGMEAFFDTLRAGYNSVRGNTVTITVATCHSNHSNTCHLSRGRR